MTRAFIAGEWREADNASRNINPSDTDDVIGEFASCTSEMVEQAIDAAVIAQPRWAAMSPVARADVLDRAGQEILARAAELGDLLAREEGKTLPEATGEVVRAGHVFRYYAGEAVRNGGTAIDGLREGVDVEVVHEPVGVVGIITPWNFPAAIPAWKIAPALAFGNGVVFKPADLVPGSAAAMADIIVRAGVPEGVFNFVPGRGSVIGNAITHSPRVDAISFTGSEGVGMGILVAAAPMGKKLQLEMGGKNPLVVLDDADIDIAVAAALNGAFFSTGQRCTASSRLIVTQGIHDRFVEALVAAIGRQVVGDARTADTTIGPVVSAAQLDTDLNAVTRAVVDGATLLCGGERLERGTPGFYMAPALMTETQSDQWINQEEIFGPIASVIRVRDYDEALAAANGTRFGLSSGICTTSLKYAGDFKRNSRAGLVAVNLPTAGIDFHVPFGGRGASSYGPRELGTAARDFYTVTKTRYTLA